MVKLLPDETLAPSLRRPQALGSDAEPVAQDVDVVVGGHLAQGVRHRLRALHMHVAPPEDRLDPLCLREATVDAQRRPQLRVHAALDSVVRGRKRALRGQHGVEVGEQRPRVGQPHQPRPRPAKALVRVDGPPVHDASLLEEVRPEAAPLHEALEPPFRLRGGVYAEQLPRQAVQLDARLQLRPCRCLTLDLAKRVENTPLHLRRRPFGRNRRREPAAPIGHDHLRRRDARQERPPRRRGLGPRQMPGQHELVAAGYQHHAVARDPYPVDVDDAVDLVDDLGHRPYRPEPRAPPPEGAAPPGHVGLRGLGEQPPHEGGEVPRGGVYGMGRARPARTAAPTLRAGPGLAVALHGRSAGRARHVVHGNLPESVTFCHDIRHAACANANSETHFLSERKSRFV